MTRVFLLAGQSNMEGQSVVDLSGKDYNQGRGTLVDVLQEPGLRRFAPLWDGKQIPVLPRVQVAYRPEHREWIQGPLGAGFTPYADRHHFGPELAFGHKIAAAVTDPILLVKCAWGGKSLYRDFRPPSVGGPVGRYYARMIDDFRDAVARIQGPFTVDAFVWYHGWNDGIDPLRAVPEYRENLIALIRDVRSDLGVPDIPAVVGEITGAWRDAPPEWERLRAAQKGAAQDRRAQPAIFVPTREFVRNPSDSPNPGHGHHEFGNAATGLFVGEALADGALRRIRARNR